MIRNTCYFPLIFKYTIYKNRHTFLRGLLRFEKSQQILNITYNKKDKYTITFMQHFTREKSYTGIVIPSSTIYKFIFCKYFVCVEKLAKVLCSLNWDTGLNFQLHLYITKATPNIGACYLWFPALSKLQDQNKIKTSEATILFSTTENSWIEFMPKCFSTFNYDTAWIYRTWYNDIYINFCIHIQYITYFYIKLI